MEKGFVIKCKNCGTETELTDKTLRNICNEIHIFTYGQMCQIEIECETCGNTITEN